MLPKITRPVQKKGILYVNTKGKFKFILMT